MEERTHDERPLVLLVDDEPTQAEALARLLELDDLATEVHQTPAALLQRLRDGVGDAVVSDLRMPEMNGLELFQRVAGIRPGLPFIIMTGFGTLQTAVEAMRAGIYDFVTKPVDGEELAVKLRRALRLRDLEAENRGLRDAVDALRAEVRIVGDSEAMRSILERVEQVAPSQATVLVRGESGTGKELIARALHLRSQRSLGPYVTVNCAAIPETLIEAELFGHKKGAFTGADTDREGRFAAAHGGTILLDEVGDLPLALQPKLLRALQEREVQPLGAVAPVPADVRLIAATHRDLGQMVSDGTFREDLFYRLNVIPIVVPPLRERTDDVLPLARHFLERFRAENGRGEVTFGSGAEAAIAAHAWPGNVRELENCIERAVVLCRGATIEPEDLGLPGTRPRDAGGDGAGLLIDQLLERGLSMEEIERELIVRAVDRAGGNVSRASRALGITRRAIQYRMAKMAEQDDEPTSDEG